MSQGQSNITPHKENAFGGILRMNLDVHHRKDEKRGYYYHHFDVNAGSGYNDKAQCDGSPVVFLRTAQRLGVEKFVAHFVDRDRQRTEELLTRINDPRCTVYNGENREFIKAIPELIYYQRENPAQALGSILCDPNGTDLPIAELSELSKSCRRLDFIINYPARVWKRERGVGIRPELYLKDLLSLLDKKYWHVQDPLPSDPHEWMILIGRNFEMGDWQKMRIYALDSPKGIEIVRKSYSCRESTFGLF
jgi:hypothetical protein